MPNCCQGATCACKVSAAAGGHMVVSGSGSANDPFVFSADVSLAVQDSPQFDMTLSGSGTAADPWVIGIGYATTARLANIPDVNAPAPTNGQVLGFNTATNKWTAQAPTTAPTGAVVHGPSLSGDGSAGNPLMVVPDATRLVQTSASGIGLSNSGMGAVVQHFATAAARTSAVTAPILNQMTMLDSNPGRIDYWNGTIWTPLLDQINVSAQSPALLQLSGPYAANTPVTQYLKQVSLTADTNGVVTLLGAADLTGRAGVLDLQFQEMGTVPLRVLVGTSGSTVIGTAYLLTTGAPAANATVTGMIRAYLY